MIDKKRLEQEALKALYELGEIEFEDVKSFYDDTGDIKKVESTKQFSIIEEALVDYDKLKKEKRARDYHDGGAY